MRRHSALYDAAAGYQAGHASSDCNGNMLIKGPPGGCPVSPLLYEHRLPSQPRKWTAAPPRSSRRQHNMSQSFDQSTLQFALRPAGRRIAQKIGDGASAIPRRQDSSKGDRRRAAAAAAAATAAEPMARFPTDFCGALRCQTVPAPPALLRPPVAACTSARQKDASNKLKVALRLLPTARAGVADCPLVRVDAQRKQITFMEAADGAAKRPPQPRNFLFDSVFAADDSLAEICAATLPDVIQRVAAGDDGCLLCIGQASESKRSTVLGESAALGLLPTAIAWVYRVVAECRQRRRDCRFSVRASAAEVCGADERLRDLLAPLADDAAAAADDERGGGAALLDAHELRAPTADRAAYYLDAALAQCSRATADDRRTSHLFFTLHIYQYKLDSGKNEVAGGRSRLHLIDLGGGEKSSKNGRASLSSPAIGNVLLTLLQGQKFLPFRESKLCQLLKEAMGSSTCRAVSVLACISTELELHHESLNTLQISSQLHRIKRQRRVKVRQSSVGLPLGRRAPLQLGAGSSGGSGGDAASSSDERARRRRFPRSASDPECTSSSEQSAAETVIFLGGPGEFRPAAAAAPPAVARTPTSAADPAYASRIALPKSAELLRKISPSTGAKLTTERLRQGETWIDGPCAAPQWVDGPKTVAPADLDSFKREMIERWVCRQDEQRRTDVQTELTGQHAKSVETAEHSGDLAESSPVMAVSMDTSSERSDKSTPETRDFSAQVDEAELDARFCAPTRTPEWDALEAEIRYLEDIAEADEDNSEAHSLRSGQSSHGYFALERCNEALAVPSALDLGSLADLHMFTSSAEQHPLRILSKECVNSSHLVSDSFSVASDRLDVLSLPDSEQLDDEPLDDDELERAMAASLSSVRSHDVLEKLRLETEQMRARADDDPSPPPAEQPARVDANGNTHDAPPLSPLRAFLQHSLAKALEDFRQPEGAACAPAAEPRPAVQSRRAVTSHRSRLMSPSKLICCSMATSSSSGQSNSRLPIKAAPFQTEFPVEAIAETETVAAAPIRLDSRPTIPALPAEVERELTNTLVSMGIPSTSLTSSYHRATQRSASGGRPSGHGSNFDSYSAPKHLQTEGDDSTLPKPGWRRRGSSGPSIPVKAKQLGAKQKQPPTAVRKASSTKRPKVSSDAAAKASSPRSPSGPKSPLLQFLRSPTRVVRSSGGGEASGSTQTKMASPYTKLTQPRASRRTSSSGHGSDSSSAGRAPASRLSALFLGQRNRPRNRESFSASSGYESAVGARDSDARADESPAAQLRGGPAGSASARRSKSAPESPSVMDSRQLRMLESQVVDDRGETRRQHDAQQARRRQRAASRIRQRQDILKDELRSAKDRLCIGRDKWSFELHVDECMNVASSGYVEALNQETRILEKRVIACKSHVMLITTFT